MAESALSKFSAEVYSTPDLIRLALPLPASRNRKKRQSHWSTVYRATEAYYLACANAVTFQGLVLNQEWPALFASAECHVRGEHDEGNLVARLKPTEDWIVRQNVVPDDKPKHWQWRGMPVQVIQRSYPELVILTLTRAECVHARRTAA